jgi:hypothetical protein
MSSRQASLYLKTQTGKRKKTCFFRSDPKELLNSFTADELDEWFTRWFILLVRNEDAVQVKEVNQDSIFSLFPRLFNFFMSEYERKNLMHRIEFVHHKGVNSMKFIKLQVKDLNYIGIEEDNIDEEEDEIQLYPHYIISVSKDQTLLLQFYSDLIKEVFKEKSKYAKEISLYLFRSDLCLHLCEIFHNLVDSYEKYFLNDLIIKKVFLPIEDGDDEFDDDSSDEDLPPIEDEEFEGAPTDILTLVKQMNLYH